MTLEQFNIYKEYHGDGDMFIRAANNSEKVLMKNFDWHFLGGLLQDLYIVSKNQASQEYKEQVLNKLMENISDKELRHSVMVYAEMLKENQSEYLNFLKGFVK
jgi:hypothetical protein